MAAEEVSSQLAGLEVADSEPAPSSPAAREEQQEPPTEQPVESTSQPDAPAPAGLQIPAKFLLPNAAAGCIIGKNGESITKIQAESEARLQLSRANEFFPGTNDRVLLISGTLKVVIAGLHFVLGKIQEEQVGAPTVPGCHELWAACAPGGPGCCTAGPKLRGKPAAARAGAGRPATRPPAGPRRPGRA